MKNTEITTDECMKLFRKYDTELYEHYCRNMWRFGWDARNYAKKLKEEHAEQ